MTADRVEPLGVATAARTRARVALVEDDLEMAQAIRHVLEQAHYEVQLFADAAEALQVLRETRAPDVILLDLWTPIMNGWQFRLAQKADLRLRKIPLIAISADRSPHAAAIDADRFLPKPLTRIALLAALEEFVEVEAQEPTPEPPPHPEAAWNALFMTLTDLSDARAHTKMLTSELRGFPAARTIALDVLLERAETCTRRALAYRDRDQPAMEGAPERPLPVPTHFDGLEPFLTALDPTGASTELGASSERWSAPRPFYTHASTDPLWVLARCLREPLGMPSDLQLHCERLDVGRVRADPTLLASLFRNLLRNAFEALVGAPEPTLRIHVRAEPPYVEISIADSGSGARVRELERAFDPFFTTKGDHAGLGLTVARRLAVRMEGRLELARELGGGTVARLLLPACNQHLVRARSAVAARPSMLLLHQPDRERALRAALAPSFQIVTMRPEDALRHILGGASYDMVLCALALPEMTGISFVAALSMTCPSQAERLVIMVPPNFGIETSRLLERLHLWQVDEAQSPAAFEDSLKGLLRLWHSLRFP